MKEMMENLRQLVEAREAEIRLAERKKVLEKLKGPLMRLREVAIEMLVDIPDPVMPVAEKRTRKSTVATEEQVNEVRDILAVSPVPILPKNILFQGGRSVAADACRQLVAQGVIEVVGRKGYRFMPVKKEILEEGQAGESVDEQ